MRIASNLSALLLALVFEIDVSAAQGSEGEQLGLFRLSPILAGNPIEIVGDSVFPTLVPFIGGVLRIDGEDYYLQDYAPHRATFYSSINPEGGLEREYVAYGGDNFPFKSFSIVDFAENSVQEVPSSTFFERPGYSYNFQANSPKAVSPKYFVQSVFDFQQGVKGLVVRDRQDWSERWVDYPYDNFLADQTERRRSNIFVNGVSARTWVTSNELIFSDRNDPNYYVLDLDTLEWSEPKARPELDIFGGSTITSYADFDFGDGLTVTAQPDYLVDGSKVYNLDLSDELGAERSNVTSRMKGNSFQLSTYSQGYGNVVYQADFLRAAGPTLPEGYDVIECNGLESGTLSFLQSELLDMSMTDWFVDDSPVDASPTNELHVPLGQHEVSMIGEDSSGNLYYTYTRTTVIDREPPTPYLSVTDSKGNEISSVTKGGAAYLNFDFGAVDACDPAPSVNAVISSPIDPNSTVKVLTSQDEITVSGNELVILVTASDSSGNESVLEKRIPVN